jgi:hypothetical protein
MNNQLTNIKYRYLKKCDMLLEDYIVDYLNEMWVVLLNPVWDSSDRKFIVGYHFECKDEKIALEIMEDLKDLFNIELLPYSLSSYDVNYPSTKFIIFLNNKTELKAKSNSDVSE